MLDVLDSQTAEAAMTPGARTRSRLLAMGASATLVLTVGCTGGSAKAPAASGPSLVESSAQVSASAAAAAAPLPTGKHPIAYWPTYHRVSTRTGVDPTSPALGKTGLVWSRRLDGAVYASPLILGTAVIAATENNTVYALRGGRTVWSRHLGAPVSRSALPCGNVNPLGITGTPVYDGSTGILYVAAELSGPLRHTLYALDAVTGKVLWQRGLDVKGMDPRVQQQRGALALAGHTVYVPLGGLYGDCGDYHGYVIGYRTTGAGPLVYQTEDTEAGIWSAPGLTVLPGGQLLASVGNSGHTSASQGYDHSDAIISLTPGLKLTDYFSPTTWADDNSRDLDLSSMSPTYIPGGKVFIAGKRGVAYLTSATSLGHVGGQLSTLQGCASYGGTAYYQGVVFAPCNDGVAAIAITGNQMKLLWKAPGNINGSPIYGGGAV
ncbi:MAG: hypothetical protein QOE76_3272, partial [Frankiales bacterium]|nr:hypothetical protein [Frankiales bacterium]